MKLLDDARLRQADFWRSVEGGDDGETENSDDTGDEKVGIQNLWLQPAVCLRTKMSWTRIKSELANEIRMPRR